jgi:hypothetical protein
MITELNKRPGPEWAGRAIAKIFYLFLVQPLSDFNDFISDTCVLVHPLHSLPHMQTAATCSRWLLTREFFYPEDGDDKFLRNVGSRKIYTAPHPRRRYSS